ncbi:short chain dehydrogenase, partial [Enterobacteriaceae bacterium TzEc013]|nr:short chain dehydrogenase [Enterobacteriaceae bacterium TzEc013]
MKIVIIGASGTVGRAVTEELSRRHEVIRVGRTQGDHQVDITSQASVQALFKKIGPVDAIVSASGGLHFGPLSTMTDGEFNQGLQDKLLGQVRLALTGQHYLNEGGSITLISGIVAHEPIAQGVNATTVNA